MNVRHQRHRQHVPTRKIVKDSRNTLPTPLCCAVFFLKPHDSTKSSSTTLIKRFVLSVVDITQRQLH